MPVTIQTSVSWDDPLPEGTRYFIWSSIGSHSLRLFYHIAITPTPYTKLRYDLRTKQVIVLPIPNNMPDTYMWQEITVEGFRLVLNDVRDNELGIPPRISAHFIGASASVAAQYQRVNHKIGVPKGKLP